MGVGGDENNGNRSDDDKKSAESDKAVEGQFKVIQGFGLADEEKGGIRGTAEKGEEKSSGL